MTKSLDRIFLYKNYIMCFSVKNERDKRKIKNHPFFKMADERKGGGG